MLDLTPTPTTNKAIRLDAERESARHGQAMKDIGIERLPPLLRPSKLAELLDMNRQRIYEMVAAGTLDGVRVGPRGMRITRASVERWLGKRGVV